MAAVPDSASAPDSPSAPDATVPDGADVVVIGAGHNGLVAANLLADAGLDVLVLEASSTPGGAVRTAEVTAPGYRNDLFSAFYPLTAASPVIAALELDAYGLHWTHAPTVLTHVTPDDRAVTLSRDVDETAESVERWAAGDGDAWRAMYADFARLAPHVFGALLQPFPPVRPPSACCASSASATRCAACGSGILPVRRFADEEFGGEGAKLLLTGNALHGDLSTSTAARGRLRLAAGDARAARRLPEPAGRRRHADRGAGLAAGVPGRAGRVRPAGRPVDLRGRRAVGVTTANGEKVAARRAVVADVAAPTLFRDLVGDAHLPPRMIEDLERFEWDDATLKLNWAVQGPIPWTAKEAGGSGTVHLGVDLDGLTYYAADLETGRMPRHPFLLSGR
jgi:phytoene dehydrogenase-like protein